jgi:hypothetical protein
MATTYKDLLDHVLDYIGGDPSAEATRVGRRAVQAGLRGFAHGHRWSYYYSRGRIVTQAMQTAGSVQYVQATRQCTLTGATWPSWAYLGTILLSPTVMIAGQPTAQAPVPYAIATRDSSTQITLSINNNPGQDLGPNLQYILHQDTYLMPPDFLASDEVINMNNLMGLSYQHPREWLSLQRVLHGPTIPRVYTFTGQPDYFGGMAMRLFPPPDNVYQLDFIYQRLPRQLLVEDITGMCSTTAGSLLVTGDGTNWTPNLVGSLIRFSADSQNEPTSRAGANPYMLERSVMSVTGPQSLTIDADPGATLTGVQSSISDPVDIESGVMTTALLREIEKQTRILRRMKSTPDEAAEYRAAMFSAWEADSRSFASRSAGDGVGYKPRLAYMPRGPDIS